jgi:hypothetical protein
MGTEAIDQRLLILRVFSPDPLELQQHHTLQVVQLHLVYRVSVEKIRNIKAYLPRSGGR